MIPADMQDWTKHLALQEVWGRHLGNCRSEIVPRNARAFVPGNYLCFMRKPLDMRVQHIQSFGINNRSDIRSRIGGIADG